MSEQKVYFVFRGRPGHFIDGQVNWCSVTFSFRLASNDLKAVISLAIENKIDQSSLTGAA